MARLARRETPGSREPFPVSLLTHKIDEHARKAVLADAFGGRRVGSDVFGVTQPFEGLHSRRLVRT